MNAFVDARKDVYTNPKNKWYEDCLIVQENKNGLEPRCLKTLKKVQKRYSRQ